jgi:hypothetical protein
VGDAVTVAALYVEKGGVYYGLDGVDPWDQERDARLYAGPWPVVAHPPCPRWGRSAHGGSMAPGRFRVGDDEGCFAAALRDVRTFGGVLEHPEGSRAWKHFNLNTPPRNGGWIAADLYGWYGWTCCVEQGHYGHRAQKATWLYAVGVELPGLTWGSSFDRVRVGRYAIDPAWTEERKARARRTGILQRLSKKQREATPIEFRDLLLSIARTAYARRAA